MLDAISFCSTNFRTSTQAPAPQSGVTGSKNTFGSKSHTTQKMLKALAGKGYPTYYGTNATLFKSELESTYQAGTLLKHVPLLDVRTVSGIHKHVTFTPNSATFKLHSDVEESPVLTLSTVIESIAQVPQTTIAEANERLLSALSEMNQNDEHWRTDLTRIQQSFQQVPRLVIPWAKHQALRAFVKKHIGATMYWSSQNV
jgi:hypothetical protein